MSKWKHGVYLRDLMILNCTWYSNGKYKSIFYIDTTPNSNLAKKCQQVLDKCEVPIKVLEKTDYSIRNL